MTQRPNHYDQYLGVTLFTRWQITHLLSSSLLLFLLLLVPDALLPSPCFASFSFTLQLICWVEWWALGEPTHRRRWRKSGVGVEKWGMAMHYWAYRVEFLGNKCESVFRDNLFPAASPAFSLPSFLALPPTFLSPWGWPHLLFSGEVKNSKLEGRRWRGEGKSTWKWSKWRNVFREFSQVLI